jgi:uncharacterized protein
LSKGTVSALEDMLAGMSPDLDPVPHRYDRVSIFAAFAFGWLWLLGRRFCIVWEKEGVSQIIPTTPGDNAPLFAKISLQVYSDLEGVGLTAAVSSALAEAGIACNVIAGAYHDHLFVPWERREEAMEILRDLSAQKG